MIGVSKVKDLVKKCLWQKSMEIQKYQKAMEQREGMIVTFEKEKDILLEMVRQLRSEVKELKLTREEKDEEIAQIRIDLEVKLDATVPSQNLINLRFPKLSEIHQKNANLKRKAADDDDTMTAMLEIQNAKMQKLFSTAADSTAVSDLETIQELIEVSDSENDENIICGAEDDYSEDEDDKGSKEDKGDGRDVDEKATGKKEKSGSEKNQALFDKIEKLMLSTKSCNESKKPKDNLLSDYKQRILDDDSESEESGEEKEERQVECDGDAESNGESEESDAEPNDDGVVVSVISDDLFNQMKKEKLSKANNYESDKEDDAITSSLSHLKSESEVLRCKMELAKVPNLQILKTELRKEERDSSAQSFALPFDETNHQETEELVETESSHSLEAELHKSSTDEAEEVNETEESEEYPAEPIKGEAEVGKVQCEECDFSTAHRKNMRRHEQRMHTIVESAEEPTRNSRALVVYDDSVEMQPVAKKMQKRMGRGCGDCEGCISDDCDQCKYCLDKKRNGGEYKLRQKCMLRKCIGPKY